MVNTAIALPIYTDEGPNEKAFFLTCVTTTQRGIIYNMEQMQEVWKWEWEWV
jgi:hypothetical protein